MNFIGAFVLGAVFLGLIVTIVVLLSVRKVLITVNKALQEKNEVLNQKIVEYHNAAVNISAREQEFMKKPIIASIRPEEAKAMARIIADFMQGKTPVLD